MSKLEDYPLCARCTRRVLGKRERRSAEKRFKRCPLCDRLVSVRQCGTFRSHRYNPRDPEAKCRGEGRDADLPLQPGERKYV